MRAGTFWLAEISGNHLFEKGKSPVRITRGFLEVGGPRWDRTNDLKIKSLLLYQLS
jgi:hypothetical protein